MIFVVLLVLALAGYCLVTGMSHRAEGKPDVPTFDDDAELKFWDELYRWKRYQ